MSAILIVLIPIALLGVVALFGFVGCTLDRAGLPDTDPYDDLVKESPLVAFWTLTETSGTTAFDATSNHFDGTYVGNVTPGQQQPGIVPGDQVIGQPVDPCPLFSGGLVSVGFQPGINIPPPFTIEAWVMPGWNANDPPALRGVVVSNSKSLAAGFGLFASTDNTWLLSLGMAATSIEVKPAAGGAMIDFTKPTHLVVVYDKKLVCTIFANNTPIATLDTSTMGTYFPVNDINIPLFIGAGAPDQGPSPPQFPFNGNIQCVAIYKDALDAGTIQSHFQTGGGG